MWPVRMSANAVLSIFCADFLILLLRFTFSVTSGISGMNTGDVVPKGYVRVLAALQDLVDRGVDVFFFQGNHDVWTYSYFEELGMKRLEQPAIVEIAGKRFCLGHGDGLGPVPAGYRMLRSVFHSRVLQFLFSLLHPWVAFRIGNGWSRHNRLARREEYAFRGEEEPLYHFAKEFSERNHVGIISFSGIIMLDVSDGFAVRCRVPCAERLDGRFFLFVF